MHFPTQSSPSCTSIYLHNHFYSLQFSTVQVFSFHEVLYREHTESIYKPLSSEQACTNIWSFLHCLFHKIRVVTLIWENLNLNLVRNTKHIPKIPEGETKKAVCCKNIYKLSQYRNTTKIAINYNNVTKKSENIYKPSMQAQTSDRRGGNEKGCGL